MKNIAIFIQTILSFVLSRKIIQMTLLNLLLLLCNLMIKRITKNINIFATRKKNLLFSVAIAYQGQKHLFLGARLFGRATLLARLLKHTKCGCSKPKCTSNRDTTRDIDFYFSLPKQACRFHLKCVSIKNICYYAFVVWILNAPYDY